MPSKEGKKIKDKVLALVAKVEDDEWADEWELVRFALDVFLFRDAHRSFVVPTGRSH